MSTPAQVLTALQNQLKNSAALSGVNDAMILLGIRDSYNQFPAIVIEPIPQAEEISNDTNVKVDIRYPVAVIGYSKVMEPDKQIVGDANSIGLADLENNIKKAISEDHTLGGVAIMATIKTSEPDLIEWPTRSISIEVEILFRQDRAART